MKKKFYLFLLALALPTFFCEVNAQLLFKVKYDHDNENWGVYVKPEEGYTPGSGSELIVGSGQVTIVVPKGYQFGPKKDNYCYWAYTGRSPRPSENRDMDYIYYGFQSNFPPLNFDNGGETLLFTLEKVGECPDTLYLIDNETDPFNELPNSAQTNPGMEFSIYDFTRGQVNFSGLYASTEWNCDRIIPTSGFGNIPLDQFRIYYNHGMQQIHVVYPDGETQVEILNKRNEVLLTKAKFKSTESISTKNLDKGYYTLRLTKDGQSILKEILID